MKANKALKRLTKIESLMSAVAERYSASAPHLRKVLKEAVDAVAKAKKAVGLQASSATRSPKAKDRDKQVVPFSQKKSTARKATTNTSKPSAKTPNKRAAKRKPSRKLLASTEVQEPTEAVAQ
jgi:hypothetical protein